MKSGLVLFLSVTVVGVTTGVPPASEATVSVVTPSSQVIEEHANHHHGFQPRHHTGQGTNVNPHYPEDSSAYDFTGAPAAPISHDGDPNFVLKTGQSFYADPGFDISWTSLSDASPIDIALTVAMSLFGLSLVIQLVSKISTMFEELLEGKRSLEATVKGAAHIDPEVVARLTNTVYRAYKFYEDHQKS